MAMNRTFGIIGSCILCYGTLLQVAQQSSIDNSSQHRSMMPVSIYVQKPEIWTISSELRSLSEACEPLSGTNQTVSECMYWGVLFKYYHWSEQLLLATRDKTVCCKRQTIGSLLCAFGDQPGHFTYTQEFVDEASAPPGHPCDREDVAK